jgi:PPOX class probable F420-dependent enzyme
MTDQGETTMTATTTFVWDTAHRAFLDDHVWGVLATGRADGSPQQSMIGYLVDDEGRIVISTKAFAAKWKNAVRLPKVSLVVPDGRQHLVVYGVAETIVDDPERAELTAAVFSRMAGNPLTVESLAEMMEQQQRSIIRITPTKTTFQS